MQKGHLRKKDHFVKRHFHGIAMAAIVCIPTIYTTLFLGSMWDPYGNTDQLPVAVVNEDHAVAYEGKTLKLGEELVENLQENAQLDFHFVNADRAKTGLADGTYYMVITIPSDFSENAATLMEDEPKKMELEYRTNPGTNYIASKMSESALAKMKSTISASVTEEYTKTIFDEFGTLGNGMQDAADGAGDLEEGVTKLEDGSKTIADNLRLLKNSALTFADGAQTLEDGVTAYTNGVAEVDDGAKQLSEGMIQLEDGTQSLSSGTKALLDGTNVLEEGIGQYTGGVSNAYAGAITLSANSDSLNAGAASLTEAAEKLQQGSDAMTTGLQTVSDTISGCMSDETKAELTQINNGLTQLQNGIDTLQSTLQQNVLLDTGELQCLLTKCLTFILTNTQDAGVQLQAMENSLTEMTQTPAFLSLETVYQQQLLDCFQVPMQALATDISSIGTQVSELSEILQEMNLENTWEAMQQLQTNVDALADGADQVIPGAQTAIMSFSSGLESVQAAMETQLIPSSRTITMGLNQLAKGGNTLQSGIGAYTDGVSGLTSGLKTLDTNAGMLNQGASDLQDGLQHLTGSVPTLTNAVSQLKVGSVQLADGTAQLGASSSTLTEGAGALGDGAMQIQDGVSQLADGAVSLNDGLGQLSNGVVTLQSGLSEGAAQVQEIHATDATYDMFSAPVLTEETYETEVKTNGSAMSAYMMPVGLWVAGLAFCVMLSPYHQKMNRHSPVKIWGCTIVKLSALGILQAVLMILCLQWFVGFSPEYLTKTIMIACLSSVAFLILEYCVNFFLDIIGDFLLLILMVLQLSGCAGTYPLELSDRFYQIIHPFMPFTYAVHGFRSGIATGQDIMLDCIILAGIATTFAGLLLFGFHIRAKKQQNENESAYFDSQSLFPVKQSKDVRAESI